MDACNNLFNHCFDNINLNPCFVAIKTRRISFRTSNSSKIASRQITNKVRQKTQDKELGSKESTETKQEP